MVDSPKSHATGGQTGALPADPNTKKSGSFRSRHVESVLNIIRMVAECASGAVTSIFRCLFCCCMASEPELGSDPIYDSNDSLVTPESIAKKEKKYMAERVMVIKTLS